MANLLPLFFSSLGKNHSFFAQKTHLFFWKKTIFARFWEKFFCFSRILQQICSLRRFLKKSRFSLDIPSYFLLNKTKIWTFRGFSPSQSFSTANLLHLTFRVSTKVQHFFSEDPTILFEKPKVCTVWALLLPQSPSTAHFLRLTISSFERSQTFVSRNLSICLKKPKFWLFFATSFFQSHSASNLQLLAIFEEIKFFSWKTHVFFSKKKQNRKILKKF